jgi:NAD-dependent deacetylase
MTTSFDTLLEALVDTAGPVLVITGAGISLASGIPTFRGTDPGAVWKGNLTELGTVRYFLEEPEGSWSWYLSRFDKVFGAKPNPGHAALADVERWCAHQKTPFLLVTQNIDGLHRDAGSAQLVEVHGSARRIRCATNGCRFGAPRGSMEVPGGEAVPAADLLDKDPRVPDDLPELARTAGSRPAVAAGVPADHLVVLREGVDVRVPGL